MYDHSVEWYHFISLNFRIVIYIPVSIKLYKVYVYDSQKGKPKNIQKKFCMSHFSTTNGIAQSKI